MTRKVIINQTTDHNIRVCGSFRYAAFSSDALPWLILHPKWAKVKNTVKIVTADETSV